VDNYKNKINRDVTVKKPWYYAVVQNPTVTHHDTKVIYGSTPEVVERKIIKQMKKWESGKNVHLQNG